MDSRLLPAHQTRSYEDFQPLFEWVREDEADTLLVDCSGFKKEHLKVQVDTLSNLKVSGERPLDGNRWSRFSKIFRLPENCKADEIHAKFEDGLLYVIMPKNIIIPRVEPKDQQQPTKTLQEAPPPPPPPPTRKAESESRTASDAPAKSQKATPAAAAAAVPAAASAAAASAASTAAAAAAKKPASAVLSERVGAVKEEAKKKMVGKEEEGRSKPPVDSGAVSRDLKEEKEKEKLEKEEREKITKTDQVKQKKEEVSAGTGRKAEEEAGRRVLGKFKYDLGVEKPRFLVVLNAVAAIAVIVGVGVYLTSKLLSN